jgi:hypothetical protein
MAWVGFKEGCTKQKPNGFRQPIIVCLSNTFSQTYWLSKDRMNVIMIENKGQRERLQGVYTNLFPELIESRCRKRFCKQVSQLVF